MIHRCICSFPLEPVNLSSCALHQCQSSFFNDQSHRIVLFKFVQVSICVVLKMQLTEANINGLCFWFYQSRDPADDIYRGQVRKLVRRIVGKLSRRPASNFSRPSAGNLCSRQQRKHPVVWGVPGGFFGLTARQTLWYNRFMPPFCHSAHLMQYFSTSAVLLYLHPTSAPLWLPATPISSGPLHIPAFNESGSA